MIDLWRGGSAGGGANPAANLAANPAAGTPDIVRLLDGLPEDQRLAVWLHYSERLKLSEVADALDMSEFRAHALMRMGLRTLTGKLRRTGLGASVTAVVGRLGAVAADAAPERVREKAIRMLLPNAPCIVKRPGIL